MKIFHKGKDGGPESTVTGYWLIEWKNVFSLALLRFENGSRDAYHTHAFNALSWLIKGRLEESVIFDDMKGYTKIYRPSLRPIHTPRECMHRVTSIGCSYAITLRGPWCKTWKEYLPTTGEKYGLTNGRVRCESS
jgi:hypothetical protein